MVFLIAYNGEYHGNITNNHGNSLWDSGHLFHSEVENHWHPLAAPRNLMIFHAWFIPLGYPIYNWGIWYGMLWLYIHLRELHSKVEKCLMHIQSRFFFLFVFCDVFLSCAPLGARLGVHTPFVVSRWRDAPKQRCDPHRSVDHLILTSDIGWGPPKILLSKKLPGSDSRFRWLQWINLFLLVPPKKPKSSKSNQTTEFQ